MKSTNNKSRPIVNFPAYFLGRPASRYLERYARASGPCSRRTSGVVTSHRA
jgi:hypothetical protein